MVLIIPFRLSPVPDWPGYYVSSCGVVFGPRKRLTPQDLNGYKRVRLYRPEDRRWWFVHQLVLLSFGFAQPGDEYEVDHLNGDPADNRLENLEWVTPQENAARRSQRLGGNPKARRGHLPCNCCGVRARRMVKGQPASQCRECHAAKEAARYNAQKQPA